MNTRFGNRHPCGTLLLPTEDGFSQTYMHGGTSSNIGFVSEKKGPDANVQCVGYTYGDMFGHLAAPGVDPQCLPNGQSAI